MTSSSGAVGGKWLYLSGHVKFSMVIVTDGHALLQGSPDLILLQGFLSLVDLLVFRGNVSILGGLFNRSKTILVSLETYLLYLMINLSSSVILNQHSRFKEQ